ncbi:MAG: hypothetical protein V1810_00980 [Candidatus Beckwithbacteria bacterium]
MAKLIRYIKLLSKRVYRPVKPLVNPLVKKIKFWQVLTGLIGLLLIGCFWPVNQNYKAQERAAWWPWSSTSHSQMALAWFNSGGEEKALEELRLANKLLIIKSNRAKTSLIKAEEAVNSLEKTRQEIESWEKVLETKPEYRDVYLRLALLNYSLYNDDKAKLYWEKANYLDPNNQEVQKVGEIISSLL